MSFPLTQQRGGRFRETDRETDMTTPYQSSTKRFNQPRESVFLVEAGSGYPVQSHTRLPWDTATRTSNNSMSHRNILYSRGGAVLIFSRVIRFDTFDLIHVVSYSANSPRSVNSLSGSSSCAIPSLSASLSPSLSPSLYVSLPL